MNTKLTAASSALFISIASFSANLPAKADLQISQTTVIDCPGMKSMLGEIPGDKRAPLLGMMSQMMTGAPWVTTTMLKGSKLRTDMGQTTVVVNAESGKEFTLNNLTRVYSIGAYDPFQKAAGAFTCQITPTSDTSTMLGHPLQRYAVTMTSSVLPKSDIVGEIWAAPDLPTPPLPTYASGYAADFGAEMSKVHGMPMAFKLVYPNTPAGTITVTSYATSIDTSTLPETAFRIPDGYTSGQTRFATKNPTTGYPLGDGMPLDTTNPVTDAMATGQSGDASSDLGGMLGGLLGGGQSAGSGGDTASSALSGMSPQMLQSLLGALGGGSGGSSSGLGSALSGSGGNISSLISPQMLQQLSSQLNSLMSDDQ